MQHENWPAAAVELKPIGWLKPFPANPRKHPPSQVAQLRASLKEWGWTIPILADELGEVIAGHGRLLAAKEEGFAQVPVMIAAGWSASQKRAYRIADNRLTETGGWDNAVLAAELTDLAAGGFNAVLTGFNAAELGELGIAGYELEDRLAEADVAPDPPSHPVVQSGELWLLGEHRVFCGDSTDPADVAQCLGGGRPAPYGHRSTVWRGI